MYNSSNIFGFIVLLLVLFIVCYYVMRTINVFNQNEQLFTLRANLDPKSAMDLVFDRNGVVDCNNTRLPCLSDNQCIDNCLIQNAVGALVCDNGFCNIRNNSLTNRPEDDEMDCDSSLGLIKVFVASEFVVDQMCVSTYRDIIDDMGQVRPYVCENGKLDIDLVTRQFSANDCTCNEGFTKMIFNQTALARPIPVCVPNRSRALFSRIYDQI
ncbi:PIF-3 [Spodoptera exempta nucleopolyhedrovirus]|uniref:PIF-3 n=1 Tax=Spodoptera exempta nucleopolyhedrovirus TaxID=1242863 RepID=A0A410S7R2_9ABAC|nr:PIF-3 [Spodoptera exempta nucleopolyhedrovirus]QAT90333.1 PIF-3 [Spodoptera exempta nucleopolyhedrovirus]